MPVKNNMKNLLMIYTLLVSVMPFLLPITAKAANRAGQGYQVNDTFNAARTGTVPVGWTASKGGAVTIQEIPSVANKSVQLLNPKSSNTVAASVSFKPISGKVTVEVKVRADTAASREEFPTVVSSRGTPVATVEFSARKIFACAGNTLTPIQPFNSGEWYVIRMELDTATDTYDLYIDGIKALSNAAFKNPVADIAKVTCAIDAGAGGTAYFDSVRIYSHAVLIGAAPAPVFDVNDYGAVGDGVTLNTTAIQNAINACAGSGGSVYIHDGIFKSGTIRLKSDMTLFVAPSATLLGSTNDADYPQQTINTSNAQLPSRKAFVFAYDATNLTIDGGGTIDGSGGFPGWHKNSGGTEALRPVLVYPVQCSNVKVQNVYLKDSAVWGLVPLESSYVTIRNIDEDTRDFGNRDGIDIVDCQHTLIENCTINSDDDCICPKSGILAGVNDLMVRGCNVMSVRANGLKFGTGSYGRFTDSRFEDIMIKHCNNAGIALESVDGAGISNITFRGIDMNRTAVPFYVIIGRRDTVPAGSPNRGIGSIDSILFEDISAVNQLSDAGSCISGNFVSGVTYPVSNLKFNRCNITFRGGINTIPPTPPEMGEQYPEYKVLGKMPAYGYFLRHVRNVTFTNCVTSVFPPDARPAQVLSDANIH